MKKLLTKLEAEAIRNALCALNALGDATYFQTVIRRPEIKRIGQEAAVFLFTWMDRESCTAGAQVFVQTTEIINTRPRLHYRNTDSIEVYENQTDFFMQYEIDN